MVSCGRRVDKEMRPWHGIIGMFNVSVSEPGRRTSQIIVNHVKKDWHKRLGSGVHADAIRDRIVHNTTWVDTGSHKCVNTP